MKDFSLDFHYQGKMNAYAIFELDNSQLKETILDPLSHSDKVEVSYEVLMKDEEGELLSTSSVTWQIKKWESVSST